MTSELICEQQNNLGIITLNRSKALNALSLEMIQGLSQQLKAWTEDPSIAAVVVKSDDERAFCAGGDIRKIYDAGKQQDMNILQFFWHEYRLNRLIQTYPKPYIALLDGITMGGGVGISQHGTHRIGAANLSFAMPETGIGFFPDVGGSYFLSRLPQRMGFYLGLTGKRIGLADSIDLGLVDVYIPREKWPTLLDKLSNNLTDIEFTATIDEFAEQAAAGELKSQYAEIASYFQATSISELFSALSQSDFEWCVKTLSILKSKSPTSLLVTFKQLQNGAELNFDACMQQEYRMVYRFLLAKDFYEGVRALIIDKDKQARWQPDDIDLVSETEVNQYFAAMPSEMQELNFS